MTRAPALVCIAPAALGGGVAVAALNNNNRNNASLPRAGD